MAMINTELFGNINQKVEKDSRALALDSRTMQFEILQVNINKKESNAMIYLTLILLL